MKYIPDVFVLVVLITLSFFMIWDKAFGETIDTGNILSNSTFTGGLPLPSQIGRAHV